ncbi:MAG: peptidase, S54 (Rhomboid) family [Armatimonadetes bacterium CSP1-3]|nr:MAG: peptidase, S54 (Rhomboid) family [Armatimonadetes bacterium CSP1-3]
MIPLRDHLPGRSIPVVTFLLIAISVLVFLYEQSLPVPRLEAFVESYGMVPFEITRGVDIPPAGPQPVYATLFTSMFMHGSWFHLGGNMWFLWIFGNNVEDVFGRVGFPIFYVVMGIAAAFGQILIDPASQIPTIGASGAIAGVMGAYLVFWPQARIDTLIFFFYFIRVVPLSAVFVLGYWILIQFLQGVPALAGLDGGVAWWAHIGGFAGGALFGLLFRGRAAEVAREFRTHW